MDPTSLMYWSSNIYIFSLRQDAYFYFPLFLVKVFNFIKRRMEIHINLLLFTFSTSCIFHVMQSGKVDSCMLWQVARCMRCKWHVAHLVFCMKDQWLVASNELWITSPINNKFICTIFIIPSSSNITKRIRGCWEWERKNREEI